ncbi:hypothetical protein C8R48DRAFT_598185 [Suillus tomentosus]|nr:hypothetical protein C8R48DRAFT_598185 [Suillus tomentosus]
MPTENPNQAVRPDFTTREHQPAWQQLIENGLTDELAIRTLEFLWTLVNNADKAHWNERQEHLEELHQCEEEEEEEEQRNQILRNEEAAKLEEQKKNKNKYAPLYATRKIKSGDYCELHYFTNWGLDDANKSAQIAEPDTLVMLPSANGIHLWVPVDAVKDPKAAPVTRDEHLTWEEFNEAAARIINYMRIHDWPAEQVDMHIQFWSALQQHHWRHVSDHLKQRALLLYQLQQCRRWHLSIGTGQTWSLEEINQDLLLEVHEELFNEQRDKQTTLAIQVSTNIFRKRLNH